MDAGNGVDGVVHALDNLIFDSADTYDLVDESLAGLVHDAAAEFVLGTSSFGEDMQREDEIGLSTVDCTLHEMLVNLGLSAPAGLGSNKLTDEDTYTLMCKLDLQIDTKVTEWKYGEARLWKDRDEPRGQAELRKFQDYFLDAQSVISRIATSPMSAADRLQRASIQTVGKVLLKIHSTKEGLRDGESSVASGTLHLS